jgi:hypothetical protein
LSFFFCAAAQTLPWIPFGGLATAPHGIHASNTTTRRNVTQRESCRETAYQTDRYSWSPRTRGKYTCGVTVWKTVFFFKWC